MRFSVTSFEFKDIIRHIYLTRYGKFLYCVCGIRTATLLTSRFISILAHLKITLRVFHYYPYWKHSPHWNLTRLTTDFMSTVNIINWTWKFLSCFQWNAWEVDNLSTRYDIPCKFAPCHHLGAFWSCGCKQNTRISTRS